MEDGLKLWDRVVFNYLIGNTDAHIENYAFIYTSDLKQIRLAPAYDSVCTRIYGGRNDMSMMIDGEIDCTKLTRESFETVAKSLNLGAKMAMQRYDFLKDNLELALRESQAALCSMGFKEAEQLGDKILKACMK